MIIGLEAQALIYAIKAHDGQIRKSTKLPYIIHPVRVVAYLKNAFLRYSEAVLAAGYLHDVLEDTKFTLEDFPSHIQHMVEHLTKTTENKIEAIEKLRKVHQCHFQDVVAIKMADRYDNCFADSGTFREKYIKKKSTIESTRLLLQYAREAQLDEENIYKELAKLFGE